MRKCEVTSCQKTSAARAFGKSGKLNPPPDTPTLNGLKMSKKLPRYDPEMVGNWYRKRLKNLFLGYYSIVILVIRGEQRTQKEQGLSI